MNKLGDLVSCPINIGNNSIVPTSRVRNIGVIIDQHVSMIDHVTEVCVAAVTTMCAGYRQPGVI